MLPEERKLLILDYINENQAVSAAELMQQFDASEATIRRDLTEMDKKGLIQKVHGGAVSLNNQISQDYNVSDREEKNLEEKVAIAKYAASLISDNEIVYIDAGTTTGQIINYITAKNVIFVTNAIVHAQKLGALGHEVYLPAGKLKSTTEAIIGSTCYESISKYNFHLAFVGTNAVTHERGFMTPDPEEAKIKEYALKHAHSPYILCDHGKIDMTSSVSFADYTDACIITSGKVPKAYRDDKTLIIV